MLPQSRTNYDNYKPCLDGSVSSGGIVSLSSLLVHLPSRTPNTNSNVIGSAPKRKNSNAVLFIPNVVHPNEEGIIGSIQPSSSNDCSTKNRNWSLSTLLMFLCVACGVVNIFCIFSSAEDLEMLNPVYGIDLHNRSGDAITTHSSSFSLTKLLSSIYNQQRDLDDDSVTKSIRSRDLSHNTITMRRNPKVLVGIFTTDLNTDEVRYRDAFRTLFAMSYPKVCIFDEFVSNTKLYEECEFIYTFVLGGNTSSIALNAVIMSNKTANDIATETITIPSTSIEPLYSIDYNRNDMTYFNIRYDIENSSKNQYLLNV